MRYKIPRILLISCCLYIEFTKAQEAVDCSSSEGVSVVTNDDIELTDRGIIRIYSNVIINSITSTKNNDFDKMYIDARLEDQVVNNTQSLIIYTTEYFPKYAEEQSANRITLSIRFDCGMGRAHSLIFYQKFKDGNYYAPEFSKSAYEFVVPMPLYAGFDLTTFEQISAKDDDLTNNEVQFSSADAKKYGISVSTKPGVGIDQKTYYAQLTLDRIYLELESGEIRFQITATDSGNPPFSTNASVIIRVDSKNSLPVTPRFMQLLYSEALSENLEMSTLQVILSADTYTDEVRFAKYGPDESLFELTNVQNLVEVKLARTLYDTDVQDKNFLEIEIHAEHARLMQLGKTTVTILVPTLKALFMQSLYNGNLTTHTEELTLENITLNIAERYWSDLTFQLDAEGVKYFDIIQHDNSAKLSLKPITDKKQWLDQELIVTSVSALLNGTTTIASTNVLIELTKRRFSFVKTFYNGTLDLAGNLQMPNILLTTSDQTTDQIIYELSGRHAPLFELQLLEDNNLQLKLRSTVSEEDWKHEQFLTAQLEASDALWQTETLLLIDIAQDAVINAKASFQKSLYQGQVEAKSNQLSLESIVYEVENNDWSTLSFALNDIAQQYFVVEQQENKALLKIKPDSAIKQWKDLDYILAELHALEDNVRKSSTKLFFEIQQRQVNFERSIYNGSVDVSNNLKLDDLVFISSDNSSDGFVVTLTGQHADFFYAEQIKPNVYVIKIRENISGTQWQNERLLSFDVLAKDELVEATSLIVLELPKTELSDSFRFERPLYEGVINEKEELDVIPIVFNSVAYESDILFELLGTQKELFIMQQTDNTLELKLSAQFKLEDWREQSYFSLEIRATLADQLDTTAVFIKLPKQPNQVTDRQPVFEKPIYNGLLNSEGELKIETMQLKNETYETDKTQYHLDGDDMDLFEIRETKAQVELSLKRLPTQEELKQNNVIALVLTATNDELKGFTCLVIEVSNLRELINFGNVFKQSWQKGQIELDLEGEQLLNMDAIQLREGHVVTEFVFTLEGDDAMYFSPSLNSSTNDVQIVQVQSVPADELKTRTQLNIIMNAVKIADNHINGSTIIFLELPKAECPELSTTLPTPPSHVPVFDSNHYIFAAQPNQIGVIGAVSAIIEGSTAEIKYSLKIENEHLAPRISIDSNSGSLQLLSYVSPGIYYFQIAAQNVDTLGKTIVDARLDVEALIPCESNPQQPSVASALLIKYIEEERVHKDIMNMSLSAQCEFKIFSMYPNDKAYVIIDEESKMLISIAIDREDAIFANMSQPQIQIKLKLDCQQDNVRERRDIPDGDYSWVLSQDIPLARDVTMLNLIIVDINDNAPEFIYPAKPTQLGYPEPGICLELFPEYLTQLLAIDKDEGLNAKIRYSMRQDAHFAIDGESGIIYPKANALHTAASTTLIVTATDRDGAADGLRTAAILFVRRLSAKHFTLMTLNSEERQDLAPLLSQLELRTQYQIESVKMATIPRNGTMVNRGSESFMLANRRYRRDVSTSESGVLQKVWVYALNGAESVTSEEFKVVLEGLPGITNSFSAETYAEVGLISNQTNFKKPSSPLEPSYDGYIAAVTVLATILAILLGFILWHFYLQKIYFNYRNNAKSQMFENETATPPADDIAELPEKQSDNMAYVQQYVNNIKTPDVDSKRFSFNIMGTTTHESTDDTDAEKSVPSIPTTQRVAATIPRPPPPPPPPASTPARSHVKFNELVERIHIGVDPASSKNKFNDEKDNDNEDHSVHL